MMSMTDWTEEEKEPGNASLKCFVLSEIREKNVSQ